MEFELSISTDVLGSAAKLHCGSYNKCRVRYRRPYTPVIYELNPPVVYQDSETLLYFDPKSTTSLIPASDLLSDEMAFVNAKIGGALLDFEFNVDFEDTYSHYHKNSVKGRSGDQPPSAQHDISMLWEIGNSKINHGEALHCSYDNSTCYYAKTVPVIHDMTTNTGYTTGGNVLNVTGWGFRSPNITATADGKACTVLEYSEAWFTCEVASSASASVVDTPTVGQHGMRKLLVNSSLASNNDYVNLNNYADLAKPNWMKNMSLAMNLESSQNLGDRFAHEYKGWFIAPASTRYRFYMSCDAQCNVKLDTTPNSNSSATALTYTNRASYFREFYKDVDLGSNVKRISDWVTLSAGQPYFLQAAGYDGTGSDHFSVGLEIEQTAVTNHHHAIREVQEVGINVTTNFEKTRITVNNPDSTKYFIMFTSSTLKQNSTKEIAGTASAG